MIMLRMEWRMFKERVAYWTAWHIPRWLVYFATIRLVAHATTGQFSSTAVPELGAMDAIKRWDK